MITKDELTLKVIDFGSCKDMEGTEFEKKIDEERKKDKRKKCDYKNFVGTPNYMAPECVRNRNSDKRSDVWSLGCVLYNLFVGFPPFMGKSDYLIFLKSTEAKYLIPKDIISPLAEDLITKLMVVDPEKRITMEQMYEHDFMKNADDKYPFMDLQDLAFRKIVILAKSRFNKFKEISSKMKKIKEAEQLNEEYKRNYGDSKEAANENEIKINLKEKEELIGDHKDGLEEFEKFIAGFVSEMEKINNEKYVNKVKFLETQMKHDLFGIEYEGFENDIKLG
jgi:serine/threonine protein kinase